LYDDDDDDNDDSDDCYNDDDSDDNDDAHGGDDDNDDYDDTDNSKYTLFIDICMGANLSSLTSASSRDLFLPPIADKDIPVFMNVEIMIIKVIFVQEAGVLMIPLKEEWKIYVYLCIYVYLYIYIYKRFFQRVIFTPHG
jgi:hypothetical protein